MRFLIAAFTLVYGALTLAQNKNATVTHDVNAISRAQTEAMLAGKAEEQVKNLQKADEEYTKALSLARKLPQGSYRKILEAITNLSNIRQQEGKLDDVEQLQLERVHILQQHPDTEEHLLGLALFDLETFYAAQRKFDKAVETAKKASAYYHDCKTSHPEATVCDRRLADVQGILGSAYFVAQQNTEAEPWLRSVVARKDDEVRPLVMLASLTALTKILADRGDMEEAKRFAERAQQFKAKYPEAEKELLGK